MKELASLTGIQTLLPQDDPLKGQIDAHAERLRKLAMKLLYLMGGLILRGWVLNFMCFMLKLTLNV